MLQLLHLNFYFHLVKNLIWYKNWL